MNKTITIYAFILGILLMSLPSCEKTSIEEYATAQGWVKPDDQTKPEPEPDPRPTSHGPVIETGVVDLGLSVDWAACNMSSSTENHFTGICTILGDKYYWSAYNISYPPESISGSDADNATVLLGYPWRTPTEKEIKELNDKCYITNTTYRGTTGLKITGPSRKTIFIPYPGTYSYWTSSYDLNTGNFLYFDFYKADFISVYKCVSPAYNKYIRPICDK